MCSGDGGQKKSEKSAVANHVCRYFSQSDRPREGFEGETKGMTGEGEREEER